MKRYSSIGLSILLLIGIIIGATLWIRLFYASIQNYRSPLREISLPPQSSTLFQPTKVVIVLISGLGYDASVALDLPVLEQLREAGATAAIQSFPPTYTQTAWATLITGAPPDTNDAPVPDRLFEDLRLVDIDTIFARAHDAELRTALLGSADWRRLIPRNQLDNTFFVDTPGSEADELIMEAVEPIIENDDIQLTLIQFTQVDFAGTHLGGTSGEAYQHSANMVDTYLGQIRSSMDLRNSTLIVLSDHGHIATGGYGGNEVEIVWQPLVMVGEGVVPGTYSDIRQTDIAPTISALLGLASPGAAQGRVLFEMLKLTEVEQATVQLLLTQQRTDLAEAYLTRIQDSEVTMPVVLKADLERAQTAFSNNNISGALQLALLVQEQADAHIATARNSRIRAEQLPRLAIALIANVIWFTIIWRRRGFHAGSIVIATIVTVALYHLLFQVQGYSYSLSSLGNFLDFPFDIVRRTAVSLLVGGGLVLIFLMLTKEEDWLTLLGTGYGFGVFVTFIFALPLFWAYWLNGFTADWRLPAVGPAFWQISSLFEVVVSASLGLMLPWPILGLNLFVNLVRHRLNQSQPQAEPDVLPGLRL